ncbi:hypothetical protein J6590_028400 [Homalodisca vitripennis]|nr:hypothetical protein J6590_028400 [Homalodisca vitripennis]
MAEYDNTVTRHCSANLRWCAALLRRPELYGVGKNYVEWIATTSPPLTATCTQLDFHSTTHLSYAIQQYNQIDRSGQSSVTPRMPVQQESPSVRLAGDKLAVGQGFVGSDMRVVFTRDGTRPWWPLMVGITRNDAILKAVTEQHNCFTGSVACGTILLKPQLVNVYVIQMRPQKLPNHRTVSVFIHCHSLPFLIFKKIRADDPARPKAASNCHSLWIHFPFVNHARVF